MIGLFGDIPGDRIVYVIGSAVGERATLCAPYREGRLAMLAWETEAEAEVAMTQWGASEYFEQGAKVHAVRWQECVEDAASKQMIIAFGGKPTAGAE